MDSRGPLVIASLWLLSSCSITDWFDRQLPQEEEVPSEASSPVGSVPSTEGSGSVGTVANASLSYHAPGDILPSDVAGIISRHVAFPEWDFPMPVGGTAGLHAYIGTQLSQYHGLPWSNDPVLYSYPQRDNQCEPRQRNYSNSLCPSGQGHQGVDIRPHDSRKNFWDVVAVNGGVVTLVTNYSTVSIKTGTTTVQYLHMDPQSIADYGIVRGIRVVKGQPIGKVSCVMSRSCTTSIHLHLHAFSGTLGGGQMYHVYPSLIASYRRAWGADDGIRDGKLIQDSRLEVARP